MRSVHVETMALRRGILGQAGRLSFGVVVHSFMA